MKSIDFELNFYPKVGSKLVKLESLNLKSCPKVSIVILTVFRKILSLILLFQSFRSVRLSFYLHIYF